MLLLLALLACKKSTPSKGATDDSANLATQATQPAETRQDGSVVLSKPGHKVHHLTSDRTHLYFAVGHRDRTVLLRVPKAGGATERVAHIGANIIEIAADDTQVWVASWAGLDAYPKTGGAPRNLFKGRVHAFAVGETDLVYSTKDTVRVALKSGGDSKSIATAQQNYLSSVGIDDTHVYWMNNRSRTLFRAPKTGGERKAVAQKVFPAEAHPIVVDGEFAYYYQGIPRSFRRVQKTGGEPTVLGTAGFHFRGMALDAEHIYWGRGWAIIGASSDDDEGWTTGGRREGKGGVMRLAKTGGESTNLCELTGKVVALAVDDAAVYWIDADPGIVAKKPLTR